MEAVAEETKGLPEAHRLGELQDWEKEHGYEYPDHARDVRTLLRMIEYLHGRIDHFHLKAIGFESELCHERAKKEEFDSLLPEALVAAAGLEDRVTKVEDGCNSVFERVEAVVAVVNDDLAMLARVANLLLRGEPVTLDQLTPEERQWVEFIPKRIK